LRGYLEAGKRQGKRREGKRRKGADGIGENIPEMNSSL